MKGKESKEIFDEVVQKAKPITQKLREHGKHYKVSNKLGLCKDCENLQASETEFGTTMARCREFNRRLNAFDPVKNCTQYWNTNMPSLRELAPMAILLETRKPIGFIPNGFWEREDYEDED